MEYDEEQPRCRGFKNGKRCRRSADEDGDGFCDKGSEAHDRPDLGPIQILRELVSKSIMKYALNTTPDSEIRPRFNRYFAYVETVTPYEVFFPTTAQAQDDLSFLLVELERTLTFAQIDRYRSEADLSYPLPRLACFSVLLRALRRHEDESIQELELPTHHSFEDVVGVYESSLVRSVQEGRIFLPRVLVDLQYLFSMDTRGKKMRLTLLDRLAAETTDEQIDWWLVALHACLPRYRKELRDALNSILGSYSDLVDCYFRRVYGPRRAEIERGRDEIHYRRLLADLTASGDVRPVAKSSSFVLDPHKAMTELEASVGRLYRLRDGLTVLFLQTYPTVHTDAILALPGSEVMREAKQRYEGRYVELRSAP